MTSTGVSPSPESPSVVRQTALRAATAVLTLVYRLYRIHPVVWRFTARHYHPALERFARLNAWMICQHAYLDVPAYRTISEGGQVTAGVLSLA